MPKRPYGKKVRRRKILQLYAGNGKKTKKVSEGYQQTSSKKNRSPRLKLI